MLSLVFMVFKGLGLKVLGFRGLRFYWVSLARALIGFHRVG